MISRGHGYGGKEKLWAGVALTASALDLQDALLCPRVLEGIQKRRLDGKKGPVGVGGRCRRWRRAVDDALIAALDGGPVDGQV